MTGEVTRLTPEEEIAFQMWARANGISDADSPHSRYDYRGYWREVAAKGGDQTKQYADGPHFPDTYKQHGHPSFSVESKYSAGPWDGGRWVGEDYVPHGADFMARSGPPRMNGDLLGAAILALAKGMRR